MSEKLLDKINYPSDLRQLKKNQLEQVVGELRSEVIDVVSETGGQLGAGLGAGIVVIGAGLGIGLLAFAAANATARQPEAAADIRATVNLPLFLLEGVAIIALVVCILAVVL